MARACRGDQEAFPRKSPKAEGKLRRGAAFVVTRADGALLLRTRPTKGLLGGMTEVPTSAWSHQFDENAARRSAPRLAPKMAWRKLPGVVTHTFTHFPLELDVYKTSVDRNIAAPAGTRWTSLKNLANEALPNVMRKVIVHALGDEEPPKRP